MMKMMSRSGILFFAALMSVGLPVTAGSAHDHDEVRQLREAGKILPLEDILAVARQRHPGRLLEVEMEAKKGRYIYEVELLATDGKVWEVYIDAATGEVIKEKEEK